MTPPSPETLTSHGITPTPQRLAVYRALCSRFDHPTVDALFGDLRAAMPSLSRTTVYSTVKLLVARGLVHEVNAEDGEVRYDSGLRFHAHFKCRACGGLFDVPVPAPHRRYAVLPRGFVADDEQLTYYGLCPACKPKKAK